MIETKKKPTVSFFWDKKPITQFDLKQVLCHLLGIAKKTIQEGGNEIPTLAYLVYKPSDELLQIVETLDKKSTALKVKRCWEIEKEEFESIRFDILYRYVVFFLHDKKRIGQNLSVRDIHRIAGRFKYVFCDQNNYKYTLEA